MILKIFTVYDSKAEAYLPPFYQTTAPMAKRVFQNMANDNKHQFGTNPSDYTLFEIGHYDDETAKITSHTALLNLGLAAEYTKTESTGVPRQQDLKLA